MQQADAGNILEVAIARHRAGALNEAEGLYTQILKKNPTHAPTLHMYGLLAHQTGRHELAVQSIHRAVSIQSDFPEAWSNLGLILQRIGKPKEAIKAHLQAVSQQPAFLPAYSWLCEALRADEQLHAAVDAWRRAVSFHPLNAEAHNNLGNALNDLDHTYEAIAEYHRAIELNPRFPQAHNNLGTALSQRGQFDDAIEYYRRAIDLDVNYAEAHNNLGVGLQEQRNHAAALRAFQFAVALQPKYTSALRNIGFSLFKTGRIAEAIPWFQRAIQTNPNLVNVRLELIEVYEACSRHAEALQLIAHAAAAMPTDPGMHSRLIQAMQLNSCSQQEIQAQMQRWFLLYGNQSKQSNTYSNTPNPLRRLRIGYMFNRAQPQLESLLRKHDRGQYEVFAYSNVQRIDPATRRILRVSDFPRRIAGRSVEQVVDAIKNDEIDVLVDTTGHTAHNCLLILAHRPAPLQVWQAGCGDPTEFAIARFDNLTDDTEMSNYVSSLESAYRSSWQQWSAGHATRQGV